MSNELKPKPVCPLTTQMALEPDLIDQGLTWICFWIDFVWHYFVPVVAGHNIPFHLLNVRIVYLLYGMNV